MALLLKLRIVFSCTKLTNLFFFSQQSQVVEQKLPSFHHPLLALPTNNATMVQDVASSHRQKDTHLRLNNVLFVSACKRRRINICAFGSDPLADHSRAGQSFAHWPIMIICCPHRLLFDRSV
jgi:hypothetical protein